LHRLPGSQSADAYSSDRVRARDRSGSVNVLGSALRLKQERFATDFERNEVMTDTTYNVLKPDNGVPIKAWTKGVPLEDAARQQLLNVAQLPFIYKWVAAMPDVHWGIWRNCGQRDSDSRRDYSGGSRCGYWLRHDG